MTSQFTYLSILEEYNCDENKSFYQNITYREKSFCTKVPKGVFRNQDKEFKIAQGNHFAVINGWGTNNGMSEGFKYLSGNNMGLLLVEFPFRSLKQTHNKLYNGMQANMDAIKNKKIPEGSSYHWNSYADYLNRYGGDAPKIKFEDEMKSKEEMVYDPFPMEEALRFFYQNIDSF